MAIKKRPQADAAAIEAFGAAADTPTQTPARPAPGRAAAPGEWPADVAKTLLIRWPDSTLPVELAEVAALEDRSQHKTALRALHRGLDILRAEHLD